MCCSQIYESQHKFTFSEINNIVFENIFHTHTHTNSYYLVYYKICKATVNSVLALYIKMFDSFF